MDKKYTAPWIVITGIILLGTAVYFMARWVRGSDLVIDGQTCCHQKYKFCFRISPTWNLRHHSDKDEIKILMDTHTTKVNIMSYLPALSVMYQEFPVAPNGIFWKMDKDLALIKANKELYQDLYVRTKTVKQRDELLDGRVSYTFIGVSSKERQMTEMRYILKDRLLVVFTLADFQKRFDSGLLDEMADSLKFN